MGLGVGGAVKQMAGDSNTIWIAVVSLVFGIGSAIVAGIISWTKKFGTTEGKQSVTTTVIENVVKQIEEIKREIENIRIEISKGNIQTTRLEERLEYLKARMDSLCGKIDQMVRDNRERYESDDHPRRMRDRNDADYGNSRP